MPKSLGLRTNKLKITLGHIPENDWALGRGANWGFFRFTILVYVLYLLSDAGSIYLELKYVGFSSRCQTIS